MIFLAALRYSEQVTRQYLKRDERPMNREWPTQEQLLVLCARGFADRNLYQKSSRKPAARMTYVICCEGSKPCGTPRI